MAGYLFVLLTGLAAGCLSGVAGSGAGAILLPVLIYEFGPQEAVPILAIGAIMSNFAKIASWRREVDWRACLGYSAAAVPGAIVGAQTLLVLPPTGAEIAIGTLFLLMIPARHWLRARGLKINLWQLAFAGLFIGFMNGMATGTGVLSIPAFSAYGLHKGALLSTEALSSLGTGISRIATFYSAGVLPPHVIIRGLIVGSSLMAGALIARSMVQRMSVTAFNRVLDGLMVVSGLSLLIPALWRSFGGF